MVFGCTSASILEGAGWDQKLSQRIEAATGIPAIATGTAMVEALRSRGIHKVALATPYPDDVTQLEATFLEDNGFSVVSLGGLGIIDSYGIPVTPLEKVYQHALSIDCPEAEGIFISCTNFPALGVIDRLEADTAKPVVTSNQASLWLALRRLGAGASIQDGGQLLASLQ